VIRLRRPSAPPDFDTDKKIVAARNEVRALANGPEKLKSKDFEAVWSERRFKDVLEREAYGKCAYCEVHHAPGGYLRVEHVRPKTELRTLPPLSDTDYDKPAAPWREREPEGAPDPRGTKFEIKGGGYWWLAYAWENWVLSCEKCNSTKWKGNLFPACSMSGGSRPPIKEHCELVEDALLLTPFDTVRDPADHLQFFSDGFVAPRDRSAYGAETIRTCGLNRETLVRDRHEKANVVLATLQNFAVGHEDELALVDLIAEARKDKEFAALARNLINEWFGNDEFVRTHCCT
jgi:5-methylcytosine-specific restriction endonuclease McrA